MTQSFQKVRALTGMKDVLPDTSAQWEGLEATVRQWLASYGYRNMRTPVLEQTRLFTRGIGEVTDIVEKEMYSFTDSLNDEQLTMRPEFTAGMVRAIDRAQPFVRSPAPGLCDGPRCFATNARSAGATASSIRSTSRRWASPGPTWMPN